ncbi:MAG: hexose kinase [Chloroflexi bacterium]|nr:hexose kinase [Chloroflexota bacterium]
MTQPRPIDCVTPNAALDRTMVVPGYPEGGVFRPQEMVLAAGGKGVNVARVVQNLGGYARCFGFVAGHSGRLLVDLAEEDGLECHFTPLPAGETRNCTILVDPESGRVSVVNEHGPRTTSADWTRLRADLLADANPHTLCFCGSLPPGSSADDFAALLTHCVAAGHSVWVDTSGAALQAASKVYGVRLKVNNDEAAQLTGLSIDSIETAARTAEVLSQTTGQTVSITMGKLGAILTAEGETWAASPPAMDVKSAVGSGDSFLAGLILGLSDGQSPSEALRWAVAAGTANAQSVGGGRFTMDEYHAVLAQTPAQRVDGR